MKKKTGYLIEVNKWRKIKFLNHLPTLPDSIISVPISSWNENNMPDFFVQNGIKKPSRDNIEIYEKVENISKKNNIPILIRENPVLRMLGPNKKGNWKDRWIRLSWNSFYMDEGTHPYDPAYNRWDELSRQFNLKVYPWRRKGDSILFTLQENGDSSLNRLQYNNIDYSQFIEKTIRQVRTKTDRPIIIRSHPLNDYVKIYLQNSLNDVKNIFFSNNENIYEDFEKAHCLITYNSTSCVESILYGIPTIVLDSSAVGSPVSLSSIDDIDRFPEFNREEWLQKIAFMQWRGEELCTGYVWELLKKSIW